MCKSLPTFGDFWQPFAYVLPSLASFCLILHSISQNVKWSEKGPKRPKVKTTQNDAKVFTPPHTIRLRCERSHRSSRNTRHLGSALRSQLVRGRQEPQHLANRRVEGLQHCQAHRNLGQCVGGIHHHPGRRGSNSRSAVADTCGPKAAQLCGRTVCSRETRSAPSPFHSASTALVRG